MLTKPYFSILLPIKGASVLLNDALKALLAQDFGDLEVLLSNNGADPSVRSAIEQSLSDSRVRYFEQPDVLDMPTHFEVVSKQARGRYFILNTHRSVLTQGALAQIYKIHETYGDDGKVVSWEWNLYYEDLKLLLKKQIVGQTVQVLDADRAMLDSLSEGLQISSVLPRSLNSSVAMSCLGRMRETFQEAFGKINPDFNFAYRCLLTRSKFIHLNKALMTSQGLSVSNGGIAFRGDTRQYLNTLNIFEPFENSPVKAALVENTIVEDFMRNARAAIRHDLIDRWDRRVFYTKCFSEINEKRMAGLVGREYVDSLERDVRSALAKEPAWVREWVTNELKTKVSLSGLLKHARRKLGSSAADVIRPVILRMRGAVHSDNVFQASGFNF